MQQIQEAVRQMMVADGQSVGRFNPEQAAHHTGLQLKAMALKLKVIGRGCISSFDRTAFESLASTLDGWSGIFLRGNHAGSHGRADHAALIAVDMTLTMAAIGALMSTAKLPDEAIAATIKAGPDVDVNYEPFVDHDAKD